MAKLEGADRWLSDLDLAAVFRMLRANGVTEVLYKVLPKNANSKNQVYLAADFSQLGKIPSGAVEPHTSTSTKSGPHEAVFRSSLDFYWLSADGRAHRAPNTKLIFYPQYPEVRLSGFLLGCSAAPSSLWVKEKRGEEPDRVLLLGLGNGRKVAAITLPPESPAAQQIRGSGPHGAYGALSILPLPGQDDGNGFPDLMRALCAIHHRGWVPPTRIDASGNLIPCHGSNCNGNTLESLLGIRSNGYSLPDYRGWEVKARQIPHVDRNGVSIVTLFTPEPTGGVYSDEGVLEFVRRYGYPDTKGRDDRLNFGGVYRNSKPAHVRTGLRLTLDGFNPDSGSFTAGGAILLLDRNSNVAASWPFVKLMDHWKAKHAQAAFVPVQQRLAPTREYRFGRSILLGQGAEFRLFLSAVHGGKVYYDPGIKVERASSTHPRAKKRSQFRVRSTDLTALYVQTRRVDCCSEVCS